MTIDIKDIDWEYQEWVQAKYAVQDYYPKNYQAPLFNSTKELDDFITTKGAQNDSTTALRRLY